LNAAKDRRYHFGIFAIAFGELTVLFIPTAMTRGVLGDRLLLDMQI
jgi:hypothetical protein